MAKVRYYLIQFDNQGWGLLRREGIWSSSCDQYIGARQGECLWHSLEAAAVYCGTREQAEELLATKTAKGYTIRKPREIKDVL